MLRQGSLLPERKDTRQYDSYTGLHQASQRQYRFVIPTQDPSTRSFSHAAMSTSGNKSGQGGDDEVDAAVREARHLQLAQFSISQAVRYVYWQIIYEPFVLLDLTGALYVTLGWTPFVLYRYPLYKNFIDMKPICIPGTQEREAMVEHFLTTWWLPALTKRSSGAISVRFFGGTNI